MDTNLVESVQGRLCSHQGRLSFSQIRLTRPGLFPDILNTHTQAHYCRPDHTQLTSTDSSLTHIIYIYIWALIQSTCINLYSAIHYKNKQSYLHYFSFVKGHVSEHAYFSDDLYFQFLVICNGCLFGDLLCLNAYHLDQFVSIFILLHQLHLLECQLCFQVIHLSSEHKGPKHDDHYRSMIRFKYGFY